MPGVDGFEICRRIKADEATSRIPVIFVTAREEVGDEARGFDVGAVDYITKPIQPPIVRARVKTHIELKRARDLLESLASIDAVTTIANRRRFDACLETEWKRCARSHSPLTIAIADVDHFKSFNDTYGHTRGDERLREVALAHPLGGSQTGRSRRAIRRRGVRAGVARNGRRGGTLDHAGDARLRARAARSRTLDRRCADHVTISAGAATLVPTIDGSPSAIVEAADAALYEAKQSGRNRVSFAAAVVENRV